LALSIKCFVLIGAITSKGLLSIALSDEIFYII